MSKTPSKDRAKSRAGKRVLAALLIVLILTAGGVWFGGHFFRDVSGRSENGEAATAARPVEIIRVAEEAVEETLHLTGEFFAYEDARLSFKIPGYVRELFFQPGDRVEAGKVLAQLDPTDFLLAVQRAEAELRQARARLGLSSTDTREPVPDGTSAVTRARAELEEAERRAKRIRELRERDSASQSELDAVETAYLVTLHTYQEARETALERIATLAVREAELEQARQNLNNTALKAPFAGVILERLTGPGTFLEEGDAVYWLVRTDTLRLRVEIPESDVHKAALGQTLRFRPAGEGNERTTELMRLLPQLEADTRVLIGESDIQNPGEWRPGLFVLAELVVARDVPSLTVPTEAIASFVGIHRVYVLENGVATPREVALGRAVGDRTIVLRGVKPNEEIILDPREIRSGEPVFAVSQT